MRARTTVDAGLLVMTMALLLPADLAAQGPGTTWMQYATPESVGFSTSLLEQARRYADSVKSGAVMVAWRAHAVVAWGDVARKLELHSVRKSLVSALFGATFDGATLNRTLADVGIDDRTPLTSDEKRARLRDLLAARSGVYLPAAYAAADQDRERPPRGSRAPDTFFFYNNWDFNVLGVAYERLTKRDLYDAFQARLSSPLGMQDYAPADGYRVYEPGNSLHPAHTFRMSTRDLLRMGQLYLQNGRWNGRQVVPEAWVRESTQPKSDFGGGSGYAYLWWTYGAGSLGERYPRLNRFNMFAASGTGGQFLLVIPEAELVIAHRGDTDHNRNVSGRDVWRIAELIVAAKTGNAVPSPAVAPLTPVPLESQLPPVPPLPRVTISAEVMNEYAGEYVVSPQVTARVFVFEGRLFANVSGMGEAELLPLSLTEFTIKPVPGALIRFERDASGRVTRFAGTVAGQNLVGVRP
ncbi:MAG: serine hydrolase, partial [Gemmatimonadota bacterium]